MNDTKVKQQIAEKIKSSSNILVTVSTNPSVDELSAALGLTVMLNKLGKHATAIFSGAIPPAITFLDPEKTFESTVDSLRDFIIALDKEKADHLRYKVEGDVVKIFITPFRTTITNEDLEFSQGDYNVELVLALGVDKQEHLDGALEAHGRILHDATVATITAGEQTSDLGSLDWHEEKASSLSEMLVSLADLIKEKDSLLDEQTATALLTGIVASTERFSNPRTTASVMTMAAQLMAAGADQQLIAAKLQEGHDVQPSEDNDDSPNEEDSNVKTEEPKKTGNGELSISHEGETLEQIAEEVAENNQKAAAVEAEHELAEQVQENASEEEAPQPTEPIEEPAPEETVVTPAPEPAPSSTQGATNWTPGSDQEPMLGGTLNATADEAADDARRELLDDQNKTILTHSSLAGSHPSESQPVVSPFVPPAVPSEPTSDASTPDETTEEPEAEREIDAIITPAASTVPPMQTLAELDAQNRDRDHDEARAAVEAALGIPQEQQIPSVYPDVVATPPAVASPFDLPTPPPLPDFSQLPPPPVQIADAYAFDPKETPELLGDILKPEPTAAPAPAQPITPSPSTPPPASNDPGQFKIPGQ